MTEACDEGVPLVVARPESEAARVVRPTAPQHRPSNPNPNPNPNPDPDPNPNPDPDPNPNP